MPQPSMIKAREQNTLCFLGGKDGMLSLTCQAQRRQPFMSTCELTGG